MAHSWSLGLRLGVGGVVGCVAVAAVLLLQAPPRAEAPSNAAENVSLAGVPVAGKSRDEVAALAGKLADRVRVLPLRLRVSKIYTNVTPAELNATINVQEAVTEVFSEAPNDSLLERVRARFTGPEARDVPLQVSFTPDGVSKGLKRFTARVRVAAKDARLLRTQGQFKPVPGAPGRELNPEALAETLAETLNAPETWTELAASLKEQPAQSAWLKSQSPLEIEAPVRTVPPQVTVDDTKEITSLLATYTTSMGSSSRNRVHNVSLASKAVDGVVLRPGDVFSYNEVVGPRVASAGYKEAPVIIRGKLVPDTGGGICQVSSTLYNAILLADFEIVRRQHHAFPVPYVPAGRDATVVDGVIDFRFKNRLAHPVALESKITGWKMTVNVWGHPDDKTDVTLERSNIKNVPAGDAKTISDPKLPSGRRLVEQPARNGVRVTLTRTVKKNGQVVRKEVVSRDYYRPFPAVVRVGTGSSNSDQSSRDRDDEESAANSD